MNTILDNFPSDLFNLRTHSMDVILSDKNPIIGILNQSYFNTRNKSSIFIKVVNELY